MNLTQFGVPRIQVPKTYMYMLTMYVVIAQVRPRILNLESRVSHFEFRFLLSRISDLDFCIVKQMQKY